MKLFKNKKEIANNVVVFDSALAKFLGLRFKAVKKDAAYLFPVSQYSLCIVDTFFVKQNIDVFFLDKSLRVLKARKNISPFKLIMPCKNTKFILETAGNSSIKMNDIVTLV